MRVEPKRKTSETFLHSPLDAETGNFSSTLRGTRGTTSDDDYEFITVTSQMFMISN